MDLPEAAQERCEECGALLTPSERQMVLEGGGAQLCAVHAAEEVSLAEAEEDA